ncbi:Fungal trans [Emericellopsis cladophorae]|uniref:Fungal trans n=1 Tax=Emericellopsis cladophorae TaxID=2686198 RepID=A0A9Q0B7V1_9HYPO|nr:Fungal trans [Emericellopsis cladophorae]KAI6777707.1 Fungal trans [Emericellopsis cladophorae]
MAQSQWDLTVVEPDDLQKLMYTFFDAQCFPLFTIDRRLFTDDFLANRNEHCSPALLRAILSLACRIEGGYDAQESHYVNLGDRMFHESRALLSAEGPSRFSLPNAQAFGLLAIHQLARYNQQDTLDLMEEGIYVLGVIARMACSSVNPPNTNGTRPKRGALRGPRVEICGLLDISGALNERDELDIFEETFTQVIDAVYTFSRAPSTKDHKDDRDALMQTYRTCLEWYSKITGALDFGNLDRSVIIFTHLAYHFCLLNLFRPYCDSTPAGKNIDFHEIRNESASVIVALCKTLQDLIPQKRWHCFLALFVYAAGHTMIPQKHAKECIIYSPFHPPHSLRTVRHTVHRRDDASANDQRVNNPVCHK